MNVTFHVLGALATAAVLSPRREDPGPERLLARSDAPLLAAGFGAGVLLHGLLDWAPHSYPIRSAADAALGLALFLAAAAAARRRRRLLLAVCFLGCLFPDLTDLGPAIANRRLGCSLPTFTLFPWHRPEHSGSIYDGSRRAESLLCHLLAVGSSLALLYARQARLFGGRGRPGRLPAAAAGRAP